MRPTPSGLRTASAAKPPAGPTPQSLRVFASLASVTGRVRPDDAAPGQHLHLGDLVGDDRGRLLRDAHVDAPVGTFGQSPGQRRKAVRVTRRLERRASAVNGWPTWGRPAGWRSSPCSTAAVVVTARPGDRRRLGDVGGVHGVGPADLGGEQPDDAAGGEVGQRVHERVDQVAVLVAPPEDAPRRPRCRSRRRPCRRRWCPRSAPGARRRRPRPSRAPGRRTRGRTPSAHRRCWCPRHLGSRSSRAPPSVRAADQGRLAPSTADAPCSPPEVCPACKPFDR